MLVAIKTHFQVKANTILPHVDYELLRGLMTLMQEGLFVCLFLFICLFVFSRWEGC